MRFNPLREEFAMVRGAESDPDRGVYGISVAAELVGSLPPNLRLYEAKGLLNPARSDGGTRRYSDNDLARIRDIVRLLDVGLNLAGVEMVLDLQAANQQLRQQVERLRYRDADLDATGHQAEVGHGDRRDGRRRP